MTPVPVPRPLLPPARVHPAAAEHIARRHAATVQEVQAAAERHAVLVVGMALNPHVLRARRLLRNASVDHHYLGYGGYLSQWQRRLALKLWCGWPTLPMVFVKGTLVGGADDLQRLLESGELRRLLLA